MIVHDVLQDGDDFMADKWIDCDWPEERTQLFEEVHGFDNLEQGDQEQEQDTELLAEMEMDDSQLLLDQLLLSANIGIGTCGPMLAMAPSVQELLPPLVTDCCLDLELESNHSGPKSNEEILSDQQPTPCPEPIEPVSLVCKWLNCDWPGTYDDLVDHIREIHVELQPYHEPPPSTSDEEDEQEEDHEEDIIESQPLPPCTLSSSSSQAMASSSSTGHFSLKCRRTVSSESAVSTLTSASSSTLSTPTSFGHRSHHRHRHRHREPPEPNTKYVCLWRGCKVFKKPSQSRSWLERHVLSHSGDKPFKCIVAGCGQRFKGQTVLEKHVNGHFNNSTSTKDGNKYLDWDAGYANNSLDFSGDGPTMMRAKPSSGQAATGGSASAAGTPSKSSALKRKKQQQRARKRSLVKGCSEDFFDTLTMQQIQYRLFKVNETTGLDVHGQQAVTFRSTVSIV